MARLRLVGGGDWARSLDGIAAADRIDTPGFVADIGAAYASARLVICPLTEGGGSKVKLVEACAYGRPIVATSHSVRGFAPQLTDHILQANSTIFCDVGSVLPSLRE